MNCNDQLSRKDKRQQIGIEVGSCIQNSTDADQAPPIEDDIHSLASLQDSTLQVVGSKTVDSNRAYEPINEIPEEARNMILKWQNENPGQVQKIVPFRSMVSSLDVRQLPRRYHRMSKKVHLG